MNDQAHAKRLADMERIYIALLRHPHDVWRALNQHVLCIARDAISDMTGKSDQEVQEHYEAVAAAMNANDPFRKGARV